MKKSTCYVLAATLLLSVAGTVKAQNISTIAGNNTGGYSGDGGQATAAELSSPNNISYDNAGNIYISDNGNSCIRMIAPNGIITTVAGIGTISGYSGDGGPATAAEISSPWGMMVDKSGNIYIGDNGNGVIRMVNTNGIMSTIAGMQTNSGFSGDGGPATAAELSCPTGVAVDKFGNVYIGDQCNNVIRMVNTSGIISTFAGNNALGAGYSGDGGQATDAELNAPVGVAADENGNIYIADGGNAAIRVVNSSGIISTIAGNGTSGYTGDGGPATAAEIYNSSGWGNGLAYDSVGNINLFIPDLLNNVVRQVNTFTNIITTCAGNGTSGYTGDGGAATAAELNNPQGVSVDLSGNLYIADFNNNVVREVSGIPLGLKNIASGGKITVYPNPAKGTLFVNLLSASGKVTLQLYNELGSQVMSETIAGDQLLNLPISGFASGTYLLKVTPENGNPVVKKINILN